MPQDTQMGVKQQKMPQDKEEVSNTLIHIMNNRLSSSRRKTKMKVRASVLIFIVIGSFNNYWCKGLKSMFWVDLTVVNINHLRRVGGHAPRMGNKVTIGRMYNKWLIWHKSIPISNLGSKVGRQTPRVCCGMPTRTWLTDRLTHQG